MLVFREGTIVYYLSNSDKQMELSAKTVTAGDAPPNGNLFSWRWPFFVAWDLQPAIFAEVKEAIFWNHFGVYMLFDSPKKQPQKMP